MNVGLIYCIVLCLVGGDNSLFMVGKYVISSEELKQSHSILVGWVFCLHLTHAFHGTATGHNLLHIYSMVGTMSKGPYSQFHQHSEYCILL